MEVNNMDIKDTYERQKGKEMVISFWGIIMSEKRRNFWNLKEDLE
jgi:hypothetical protein